MALDRGDLDRLPDASGEAACLLDRLLEQLSPAERLVKTFRDLDGFTAEKICLWTGWSASVVSRHFRNAQRSIDRWLGEACLIASRREPRAQH